MSKQAWIGTLLGKLRREPPPELPEQKREELEGLPDDVLAKTYYELRDAAIDDAGTRRYPNLARLHGSALEREKDRREVRALAAEAAPPEIQRWYEVAARQPCTAWLEQHLTARHSLESCMSCGVCTARCPAARFYDDYNPRHIVDVALSGDEERILQLLREDTLWLCAQCGSCKAYCPRGNSIMGLVSSLRLLAQVKKLHAASARGRQQYAARHLWGGNFWNRGLSMHFRNVTPETHPDFGPRYARYRRDCEQHMERLGAHPDRDGWFAGRKLASETLAELRECVRWGGTLFVWDQLEETAAEQAAADGLDIDDYLEKVRTSG